MTPDPTWLANYVAWSLVIWSASAVAWFLFGLLGWFSASRYCEHCGRAKQYRWRLPKAHARRLHCVFCDKGEPW